MPEIGGLQVVKVSQRTDYVKMLVYGVPGAGKTYLAGTADDVDFMRPVLFVDIEGGTKTIRKLHPDVEVLRVVDKFDDKGRLKRTAWERLQDVYEDLRRGVGDYRTVVIDNLTEAQKISMYSVLAKVTQENPIRDPDIPAERDWGKSGEMVRRMVRAFRDLEAHVIFTCHQQDVRDQRTGTIEIRPSLPGKLSMEIAGFVDEVLYLYTKPDKSQEGEVIRKILCNPTEKYIAKTRGGLPTVIDDPTMAKIASYVLDSQPQPVGVLPEPEPITIGSGLEGE